MTLYCPNIRKYSELFGTINTSLVKIQLTVTIMAQHLLIFAPQRVVCSEIKLDFRVLTIF